MNQMIFRIGTKSHRLVFSNRAWRLLSGPRFETGKEFVRFCGVYDRSNFSVAGGLKDGAFTLRNRYHTLHLAQMLVRDIEADADLLAYDYRYEIQSYTEKFATTLLGLSVQVWTKPPGCCYLNVYGKRPDGKGRVFQWIDLRPQRKFSLDDGVEIVVRRKKQKLEWPILLKKLIRFREAQSGDELRIEFKE